MLAKFQLFYRKVRLGFIAILGKIADWMCEASDKCGAVVCCGIEEARTLKNRVTFSSRQHGCF